MRKPAGIVVAAVILGLIALAGTAFGVTALSISAIVGRPVLPKIPGVRPGLYLMVAFFLLCLWTMVGLFRLRRWARPAMVVIGALIFVGYALAGGGLLWVRQLIGLLIPPAYSGSAQSAILGAVILSFVIALVGLSWTIYFNRARVRAAFAAPKPAEPSSLTSSSAVS